MLRINNNEYKVLTSDLKYVDATYNSKKGYSILVSLDIQLNEIKGYISFYVDFFDDNDIKIIENVQIESMQEGIATLKKNMVNKATSELVKGIKNYYNISTANDKHKQN